MTDPRRIGSAASIANRARYWWAQALALGLIAIAPIEMISRRAENARASLFREGLNDVDHDRIEHGYYERLVTPTTSPVVASPPPATRRVFDSGPLCDDAADLREYVLKPGFQFGFPQVSWRTNDRGMRDRDYPEQNPPRTLRIGLAGDSIAAGWAVNFEDSFEAVWERELDERLRNEHGSGVEVLNFAVPGHGPIARVVQIEKVASTFDLDLIVFESTPADLDWDARRLRVPLSRGIGFDHDILRDLFVLRGIEPGWEPDRYRAALKPLGPALLERSYRAIADFAHQRRAACAVVVLPRVGRFDEQKNAPLIASLARSAGVDAVADLTGAFDDLDPDELAVGPGDYHPNELGHKVIAESLLAADDLDTALALALDRARRRDVANAGDFVADEPPAQATPCAK
ncbi:MAG: SGNH/GDSL hydrolase family protein [Planctomycetota bacterium]|nr:SGNH/GDSL hydrolase family protein [Planctomycetota bacterium]